MKSLKIALLSLLGISACAESELEPVTTNETAAQSSATVDLTLPALERRLSDSVKHLAETIGERNLAHPQQLQASADWIVDQWQLQGLEPQIHTYSINGKPCHNIDVTVSQAKPEPVVIIGAHYDSVAGTPGADDNASGVASMLEVSRALAGMDLDLTVRCVAFVNEEPPYFSTYDMGSFVYADMIHERGDEVAYMISIESVGFFRDEEGSQKYPPPLDEFYPSVGNFIGVVGDLKNGMGVGRISKLMKASGDLAIESAVLPGSIPGVDWSDHASFWHYDYPGVMVTDTAPFRNPNYHEDTDTLSTLDFSRHAQFTAAFIETVKGLATTSI